MRNRVSGSLAALTGVAMLVAGCGGDDPTGPGSDLSQAEAMELFGEILSAVFLVGAGAAPALPPEGVALAPQTLTINQSAPCAGGGSIAVTGTYTYDVDTSSNGSFTYNIVESPSDCAVATSTGQTYRVDGNPNIQMAGSYSVAGGAPVGVFGMTFTGGMSWTATNGGVSGSCTVDLTYSFDWEGQHGSVKGHMCGYAIDTQY
jgi:hypothetical protein